VSSGASSDPRSSSTKKKHPAFYSSVQAD